MEDLTIEQSLQNIETIVGLFKGSKQEHILLEQCLILIKGNLKDYKELLNLQTGAKEVISEEGNS